MRFLARLLISACLLCVPATSWAVITDDFNRASLGANWAAAEGTVWAINASTVVRPVSTYSQTGIIRTEAAFPNDQYAQVETRWTTTSDDGAGGLRVRSNGTTTAYVTYFDAGTGLLMLYKRVAGVNTYLGDSGTSPLAVDTTGTLKLEAIGTAIKAYVNGVEKISATDAAIASGKPGLHALTGDQLVNFDNFESTDASGGGGPVAPPGRMRMGVGK